MFGWKRKYEELKAEFERYRGIHPEYDIYRWMKDKPRLAKTKQENYGKTDGIPRGGILIEIPTGEEIYWSDVDGDGSINLNSQMDDIVLYWFKNKYLKEWKKEVEK